MEEEEKEEGMVALGLVVIVRLAEREAGEKGMPVVAVDLVVEVWLVEGEENVIDLVSRDLVEFMVLTCLYLVKAAVEEVLILEVEVRGTRRVEGMLTGDRCDEYEN